MTTRSKWRGPVLLRSRRLGEADLADIARHKGQEQLLAIASRQTTGQAVTDVLVDRGDDDVLSNVASKGGASFSEGSFARLIERAGDHPVASNRSSDPTKDPEDLCDDFKQLSYATARHVIGHWHGAGSALRAVG